MIIIKRYGELVYPLVKANANLIIQVSSTGKTFEITKNRYGQNRRCIPFEQLHVVVREHMERTKAEDEFRRGRFIRVREGRIAETRGRLRRLIAAQRRERRESVS